MLLPISESTFGVYISKLGKLLHVALNSQSNIGLKQNCLAFRFSLMISFSFNDLLFSLSRGRCVEF